MDSRFRANDGTRKTRLRELCCAFTISQTDYERTAGKTRAMLLGDQADDGDAAA